MRLMVIARRRHSERTESAGHVAPSSAAQPHRPLTLLAREALLSVRDVGSVRDTEQGRVRYLGGAAHRRAREGITEGSKKQSSVGLPVHVPAG